MTENAGAMIGQTTVKTLGGPPSWRGVAGRRKTIEGKRSRYSKRSQCRNPPAAFAELECVVDLGEERDPPLDSCIMVPHFAYPFECIVAGDYAEFAFPKVTSEAFENPNDAAGLQIERSPMPLRV